MVRWRLLCPDRHIAGDQGPSKTQRLQRWAERYSPTVCTARSLCVRQRRGTLCQTWWTSRASAHVRERRRKHWNKTDCVNVYRVRSGGERHSEQGGHARIPRSSMGVPSGGGRSCYHWQSPHIRSIAIGISTRDATSRRVLAR